MQSTGRTTGRNPHAVQKHDMMDFVQSRKSVVLTSSYRVEQCSRAQVPLSPDKPPLSPGASKPPASPKPPLSPKPASCIKTPSAPKSAADFERCCKQLLARKDTRQLAAYVRVSAPPTRSMLSRKRISGSNAQQVSLSMSVFHSMIRVVVSMSLRSTAFV